VTLDQSALERYRLKLRYKVSYHLGGSSPDVEEVVQEVMLRFVRALKTEKMRNPDSIAAFLSGICNNVIYEYKRRQRKEPVPNPDASPESPAGLGADMVELRQVIGLVMNQLAPREREILRAFFLEERDKSEICRAMGLSEIQFRVVLFRAKEKFRELYRFSLKRKDTYNRNLDYGSASSDLRHRFTFSPTYSFPSVAGFGGLLDGWRISSVFRYQVGRPINYTISSSNDFAGTGRGTRYDLTGDASDFHTDPQQDIGNVRNPNTAQFYAGCRVSKVTDPSANCSGSGELPSGINPRTGVAWVLADLAVNNPGCVAAARSMATLRAFGCWTQGNSYLTPPPLGSYGNSTKGQFLGPSIWLLDFSVRKRQKVTERFSAEFAVDAYNVLNHPVFNNPSGAIGTTCSTSSCGFQRIANLTPDVAVNNPIIGSGGPRRMQFGVKLVF
jgi:RNA polymerase sigma factor (sigma-70 family)